MASSRKSAKQSSAWGGFLQQAVLSVESRLDSILADEGQPSAKTNPSGAAQEPPAPASTDISKTNVSRSSSAAKTNDHLQERLLKAVAKKKKKNEGRSGSIGSTGDVSSRTGTPPEKYSEGGRGRRRRSITMGDADGNVEVPSISVDDTKPTVAIGHDVGKLDEKDLTNDPGLLENQAGTLALSQAPTPVRLSLDEGSRSQTPDIVVNGIKAPHEGASPEEMYMYIEKIDALQAKLQYLAQEAAASARATASTAKVGSTEKNLSEKDEKIALLMEEGQKLSKTEMKHLMTIKKLRSQAAENAKLHSNIKARAENAEAILSGAEQRASRAEAALRRVDENPEASVNADHDLAALRSERDALTSTVAEIRVQLGHTTKRAENAEGKLHRDITAGAEKEIAELKDDLTSVKIEREISEDKLRRELRDLKASLEREKEHSTSLEVELRAEQSLLESKMESLRNRAEEASSGSVNDSQAKLLRQIETLQNQYAVASENWQGIEGSLLARIATVETERDSLEHREGDLRKKIRDVTQKAKNAEKESETSKNALYQLEHAFSKQKSELQQLGRKLKETEDSLMNARKELEAQQQSAADSPPQILHEKNKRKEHVRVQPPSVHQNESPTGSIQKGGGVGLGLDHISGSFTAGRSQSRRSSALTPSLRHSSTPPRQNSFTYFQPPTNGTIPETPASQIIDQDEYFPEPPTPASLGTQRGVNDLISASTVGGGPSVQLVERMSASVRRLESEKVASKDELTRLTEQRDESRKEVVALMREVEQKRASDEKTKALDEELRLVNERHQTTLEMLGEKSELVEELRADVADVKQMYRDLVDSTMK